MKHIIINQPHLQSLRQKLASALLVCMSWLLWLYFLLPLITLAGWLMGLKSLSDEIRWFGGYKTLLELLQMYGGIILMISSGWLVWTLALSWIHASIKPSPHSLVTNRELAKHFNVDIDRLIDARSRKKTTVYHNDTANIIRLEHTEN
ncbi:poly-beta-1,6-N-acetyl-D-glucosamine biosynthesis protein PgaD [Methylomonas sp. MgM2]